MFFKYYSTMLFYIYVQTLEEEMEKKQIGGVVIGKNILGYYVRR